MFIRDKSALSSERMLHKGSAAEIKNLIVSIKGLGAKKNLLAIKYP